MSKKIPDKKKARRKRMLTALESLSKRVRGAEWKKGRALLVAKAHKDREKMRRHVKAARAGAEANG